VLADFPDFDAEIYVIDAADISIRTIGRNLPNTPLLSAAVKLTGIMKEDDFFTNMEKAFAEKFAAKPEVIGGNMNALKEAWVAAIRINEVSL
jgi:pyruvate ferredoxin oxidoreductase gamma subunit